MKTKLLEKTIKAVKPPAQGQVILWDSEQTGLGFRITANGARAFILDYRCKADRTRRRIVLGCYPEITLTAARSAARDMSGRVAHGGNPAEERREAGRDITVARLIDLYLEDLKPRLRASSLVRYRRSLTLNVSSRLGTLKVKALTRAHFLRLQTELLDRPGEANHAMRAARAMMTWAINHGYVESNHAVKIPPYKLKVHDRVLTPDELRRLFEALDGSVVKPEMTRFFKALLLTGCRCGEMFNLTWPEIDLDAGTIRLLETKTGKRTVYLSDPAREFFVGLPRTGERVFDLRIRPQTLRYYWLRICAAARIDPPLRIHDIRHAYASIAVLAGLPLFSVSKLLGHANQSMSERYSHLAADPLRAAANQAAAYMTAIASGKIQEIREAGQKEKSEAAANG